ncbi:MAG: alpha/beta fold hydrolase BchO [Pseudomonadota bacterium]
MDWSSYAEIWPSAEASRFVEARPHRWHVQEIGAEDAPRILLLHGTGGATHSWRDVAPRLGTDYRVIVPDLPGHGFTKLGALQRSSLELMTDDLMALVERLGAPPDAIVGHSSGAALALRMAQRGPTPPRAIVGINAALEPFAGAAGWLFPMIAKALASNPFTAPAVARMTTERSVKSLIEGTGSQLDPLGLALYRACISDAGHVDGALTMMAQWRLDGLTDALPNTTIPTLLLTGAADRSVPPDVSVRAADRMPQARHERFDGLGHLAHEEAPEAVTKRIAEFLDEAL